MDRRAQAASSLLIVAGEPSGDRMAAEIARTARKRGLRCAGMAGAASRAAGVDLVADMRDSAAMGLSEVSRHLPAVVRAYLGLRRLAQSARPKAAVLVDYVEFNLRMGRFLRRLGVPVLFCVAPQVWAWRPGRRASVGRALDRMAVILPFEQALWRDAGVDAHYVGHPATDFPYPSRAIARERLGMADERPSVALLPGSRPHEVHRHAIAMLETVSLLKRRRQAVDVRLLAAPWLDSGTRLWLEERAAAAGVPIVAVGPLAGAIDLLPAFDAALVASGTASLECALAGALPVVVYRVSSLTAAVARRLLRTPHVALPNVVLQERCFPELLQEDMEPVAMARALELMLERRGERGQLSQRLRDRLACGEGTPPGRTAGERAFALLSGWVGEDARAPAMIGTLGAPR